MELFNSLHAIRTDDDALRLFKRAIEYRSRHKNEDGKIARFVYDSTHKLATGVRFSDDIDQLRAEFIALEAPGMPPDNVTDPDEYADQLWVRLDGLVEEAIARRAGE